MKQKNLFMSESNKLAALIRQERAVILARWRQEVRELPSARALSVATLNDHIPVMLDEVAAALEEKSDQTIPEALAEGSSPVHGSQRLKDGFDIEEVVAEYNVLRGCIHRLADVHAAGDHDAVHWRGDPCAFQVDLGLRQ